MNDLLNYREKYVTPLLEFIQGETSFVGLALAGPPQRGKTLLLRLLSEACDSTPGLHCAYLDLELLASDKVLPGLRDLLQQALVDLDDLNPQILEYLSASDEAARGTASTRLESTPEDPPKGRAVLLLDHCDTLGQSQQQLLLKMLRVLRQVPRLTIIAVGIEADFLAIRQDLGFLDQSELAQFWAGAATPADLVSDFPIIDPTKRHTPGLLKELFSRYNFSCQLLKSIQPGACMNLALLRKLVLLHYQWPQLFDHVIDSLTSEVNLLLELESLFCGTDEQKIKQQVSSSPILLGLSRDIYLKRLLGAPPYFESLETIATYCSVFSGSRGAAVVVQAADTDEIWSTLISGERFELAKVGPLFNALDFDRQEDYLHRLISILIDISLDDQMRNAAALALARVVPRRVVRQLEYVLESSTNAETHFWVVKTIGMIDLEEARDLLKKLLSPDEFQVVSSAGEIFIDEEQILMPLENDLKRQEASKVRLQALDLLEQEPLDEVRELLEQVREKDLDPNVRARAAEILNARE